MLRGSGPVNPALARFASQYAVLPGKGGVMRRISFVFLFTALTATAADLRVSSDQSVGGFKFPESAGYDAREKVLYVGNFGGEKLAPAEKDGLGYISKVGLNGKMIEERVFPAKDGEKMS